MVETETRYVGDDGRYPSPCKGDIQGWGNPRTASLVVAVRWVGPTRWVEGNRGNEYAHADGYEVDTVPCPPDKLLHYLRTGEWFHPNYPGWKEAVAECERLLG
jgi:hypothetical protein